MNTPAHPSTTRILRHLLLWGFVWLFLRYINYGLYVQDNSRVLTIMSLVDAGQVVALFYLFGYVLLPRYVYRFRFAPFSLFVLLVYYAVYLINYLTSYLIHDLSNNATGGLLVYTKRGWALLQSAGVFGCFTSVKAGFLTLGNSFFYVSILLTAKVTRDLLLHRTRTLLAERDAADLERANLALERDNLTLELDLLKSQVNPHFLFNALNSIYARVVDANEPAAELVLRLAELMRYNLYEADVAQIALPDEIAYIENYLSLERMRHASLIEVIFSADDDFSGYRITPLVLITLVENAFKHGLGAGSPGAYVLVDSQMQAGTFFFTVQNSIPPARQTPAVKEAGGLGLLNLKKRLALLYPDRYQLAISQTVTSYTVTLQLQLDAVA